MALLVCCGGPSEMAKRGAAAASMVANNPPSSRDLARAGHPRAPGRRVEAFAMARRRRVAVLLKRDWPYKRHPGVFAGTQQYARQCG